MINFKLKLAYAFCFVIISLQGFSQTLDIFVGDARFQFDDENMIILSHITDIDSYQDLSQYEEINISFGKIAYSFTTLPSKLEYSDSYGISNGTSSYTLYFTQLPIISINSGNTIVDEPKVLADFIYADEIKVMSSKIGIEIRGGYSQTFPKKTYDFELWQDDTGQETWNTRFGDLRVDDDWILDALYNEPLRIRSFLGHKLWMEMHDVYYSSYEPLAKPGADVMFVEVFLNRTYNGVYILSEQIDKKQLKIRDYDGMHRGELYKSVSWGGACTFDNLPAYSNSSRYWGGYDYHYPDEDQLTDWSKLYEFTDFVMNSTNRQFNEEIWNRFDKENCLDYFIFLNVLRAADNTGKNIFVSRYDNYSPYIYSPWDLDACFGTDWMGHNEAHATVILKNGMFRRALALNSGNYATELKNKWNSYRDDFLSNERLHGSMSDAYESLLNNNVYEREKLVYPNYDFSVTDFTYINSWLDNRLDYLDSYFDEIIGVENEAVSEAPYTIYPNPADDHIRVNISTIDPSLPYVIFDIAGKTVRQGILEADQIIDLADVSSGLYFIRIKGETHKFIVK